MLVGESPTGPMDHVLEPPTESSVAVEPLVHLLSGVVSTLG